MKLYEVPNKTWVLLKECGEKVFFDHPDGMYSVCYTEDKKLVHVYITSEVEIVDE